MYLEYVSQELINYLILNYLRLIYAQFLTSFLTVIFVFLSTWLLLIITSTHDLQPSTPIVNQMATWPLSFYTD